MRMPIYCSFLLAGSALTLLTTAGVDAFSIVPRRGTQSKLLLAATTTADSSSEEGVWKPIVKSLEERRLLRGKKYTSETLGSIDFHHIEFYCGDAKSMASKFAVGLGMNIVGETGQSTGNDQCVSYGLVSGTTSTDTNSELRILLTAPYSQVMSSKGLEEQTTSSSQEEYTAPNPLPGFQAKAAHDFFQKHGLAVKAVGIEVQNVQKAYENAINNGAVSVLEPTFLKTCHGQETIKNVNDDDKSGCYIAEIELYGNVALRFISFVNAEQQQQSSSSLPFLPHLAPIPLNKKKDRSYGLYKIDHAVGNVHNLLKEYTRIQKITGFHEFAEFTAEDVGTVDSGLNSIVLASDNENILFPLNEPTVGRRKSQILTFLEQNEGPGLQHLALKTKDIFKTISSMREAEENMFGFELMKRPSDQYYKELPERLGDQLTTDQYEKLEELGILADADDEGILLQVFTKPIGDRPTFFFEIIQRIGCIMTPEEEEKDQVEGGEKPKVESKKIKQIQIERPGCGGFGQGNFRELFRSIEDHEKTLKV